MSDLLDKTPKQRSGCGRWHPHAGTPWWRRILLRLIRAGMDFWRDDCVDRASLLAYTTLLAIVPLLAVIFSLWNLIGFTEEKRQLIDRYVFQSFDTEVGEAVIHWLNVLAARGAGLGW